MTTPKHLVVVGGVAAGMSAAAKARRTNPDLAITVFERGEWIAYSACGLPYLVGGLVESEQKLVARTVAEFAKQRIDVQIRHAAMAINAAERTLRVTDQGGGVRDVPYDALIIATGARPRQPNVPGADLGGVFNLYTMTDAQAMRDFIAREQPKKAVIVGGGYIGLEMAENLAHLGLALTVVQRPEQLFSNLDSEIGDLVADELKRRNVDLSLCDSVLEACAGSDGKVTCVETSHGNIDADLVLFAIGIQPNIELAQASGIALGATGAIVVDDHLRTNLPDVYAAGDCAEHFHRITGAAAWVPLGTTANKQGRIAGTNAAGGAETFRGILGTAISRVFELEVGCTGITEKQAQQLKRNYVAAVVDYTDIVDYYPDHAPLRVKLIAERGTGRLLGAQAAGRGVDKRIDVAATALYSRMTVEDLAWLDLGYAPPFNSVWDPLHVAASKLLKEI